MLVCFGSEPQSFDDFAYLGVSFLNLPAEDYIRAFNQIRAKILYRLRFMALIVTIFVICPIQRVLGIGGVADRYLCNWIEN